MTVVTVCHTPASRHLACAHPTLGVGHAFVLETAYASRRGLPSR
jgi:hypothetical protein